jgi:hypothetical protein
MNSTCGFYSQVDTGLYTLIKSQSTSMLLSFLLIIMNNNFVFLKHSIEFSPEEDYKQSSFLMLFLAVSLARLARHDSTSYKPDLQAHSNNAHCLAKSIVTLTNCLFYTAGVERQFEVEKQLNSFLACASSALLKLCHDYGQDSNQSKDTCVNKESVYIILEQIVQTSTCLDYSQLESYFPYALIRSSYRQILKQNASQLA